jgi:hypothetical protein
MMVLIDVHKQQFRNLLNEPRGGLAAAWEQRRERLDNGSCCERLRDMANRPYIEGLAQLNQDPVNRDERDFGSRVLRRC